MPVTADFLKATAVALGLFLMNMCEMQPIDRPTDGLDLEYRHTANLVVNQRG